MHVINASPECGHCHHPVDRAWSVCPHCATALPKVPDEQRVPARQMVEAARQYRLTRSAALPTAQDAPEAA
jgi:predicted amidophosphoribosyltransferase